MEEESASEILEGEIVGIKFALATHHEIVSLTRVILSECGSMVYQKLHVRLCLAQS